MLFILLITGSGDGCPTLMERRAEAHARIHSGHFVSSLKRLSHLLSVCLGLAGLLSACNERAANVAPSPTSPTPQATPTLLPNPQPRATVSGTVFQTTPQGQRTISGARVLVVDLVDGPYVLGWDEVVTDIQGRFTSAYVFPGRAVKLTAYSGTGQGLWNQSGLSQMCAVHPTISEGNTIADIELVEAGVSPVTLGSPALSGVVYQNLERATARSGDSGSLQQQQPRRRRCVRENRRERPLQFLSPSAWAWIRACRVRRSFGIFPRRAIHPGACRDPW